MPAAVMSKDSITLYNDIAARRQKVQEAFDAGNQEAALKESGYVSALEAQLKDQLEYEQGLRNETGAQIGANVPSKKTMAELFLGPKDSFKGITPEQAKAGLSVDVSDALDLPTPEVIQQGFPLTTVPTGGFLSTIPTGTTEGNITFMQPAPSTNRLIAPHWENGLKKPPQSLSWLTAHCNVEWFAYTFPVMIPTLLDYGQIESVINTEMRNGFVRAQRFYSTQGNNPQGIIGILDPLANIKVFDGSGYEGANDLDKIRLAIDRVTATGGVVPTHVLMHPFLKTRFDLMKKQKDSNEYLALTVNGRIWELPIVEDENAVVLPADGSDPTKYQMLIYYSQAATWYTQHGMTLSAMPVGNQFLENKTTFRLEGSHALQIRDPNKFIKLEYDINEVDKALTRSLFVVPAPKGVTVKGYGVELGKNVAEFGHFAIDGTNLVGEADKVEGYTGFAKDSAKQSGYYVAINVEPGSKVQKDAEAAKTVDETGVVVAYLGKESIEAKKIKITDPDGAETTINVKVTANSGPSKRAGARVRAS